ncbi:DUF4142 domain-containing protein [Spirosoma fluviale]|uniref:Putative membrane protein n=1 Tax=Spirosoma fluviale TaxID=1597977 RepID=A0A286G3D0_9BACT|nr:DUF4142 domain-containing protein [Spirosoma fluviale]SOD89998.1 putative membrane protein [Spirosoma fluviale]
MNTKSMAMGLLMVLALTNASLAQQTNSTMSSGSTSKVGNESMSAFDSQNKKGAAAVAAVTPNSAKLSTADQDLMMQVAKGGMMQLEASRLAVQNATNDQVKALAQAEVDEQTGLSAKLQEIASAKGVTLPTSPDAETQAVLTKLQSATGMSFDRLYLTESGVKGHEKLDSVMSMVESKATDPSMKNLAKAAHPLVKTHLKVARQIMNAM